MSDPISEPNNDNQEHRNSGPLPGLPRWLKVSGIVLVAVIAVALIVVLATGAEHGPGLHESWVFILFGRKGNLGPLRWY